MSGSTEAIGALKAAGDSDPGLLRDVNEDRFHFDISRGLFMVIDGVGGQAAGGKAADTAVSMLRSRLERETGPLVDRLREAITIANNEIHRVAGLRPEWNGMACVLTIAVVDDTHAVVAHVGDTRLYKIRHNRIEKVTRDHSPVGEREDAHELSELEAMHHPRRNEVYRDVGSEPHESTDLDFIDVSEVSFEPDAALLLCSDGLTDLVDSATLTKVVERFAGQPSRVVQTLIDAANEAGGKDNVTVVYVEGAQFTASPKRNSAAFGASEITRRLNTLPQIEQQTAPANAVAIPGPKRRQWARATLLGLLVLAIVLALTQYKPIAPLTPTIAAPAVAEDTGQVVVQATQSIAQALDGAAPGTTIIVEPGEYRETLVLKSHVRLVSQVRHGAVIRLPGAASEADAAIVAKDVTDAAFDGFRVVGDAATPLGAGVLITNSTVSMSEVEITGATSVAIDIDKTSHVTVSGSDIRDNLGAAVAVRAGADATLSHNVFMRNGTAGANPRAFIIEPNSAADFIANVLVGVSPDLLTASADARAALIRNNWFVDARTQRVLTLTPPARRAR